MLVDDGEKVTVGAPLVDGAKVVVEVLSHVKGDKVLVSRRREGKGIRS